MKKLLMILAIMLMGLSLAFADAAYTENADDSADLVLSYHKNDKTKMRKIMKADVEYICRAKQIDCSAYTKKQQARVIYDFVWDNVIKAMASHNDLIVAEQAAKDSANASSESDYGQD
jgi:hypothetical protein